MKYIDIMIVNIVLIKIQDKNPRKDQNAALSAFLLFAFCFLCVLCNLSHIYAHKNGHHSNHIIQKGHITIHNNGNMITHMIHHIVHH